LKFLLARNRPETHTRSRTLSSDKGSGGPARGLHKLGLPEVNVCAPYVSPVSALGPPSAGRWGQLPGKPSRSRLQACCLDSASPLLRASVDITRGESHRPHPTPLSLSASLSPKALETLQNTSNLLIREGQDLRLLCAAAGNPPAELSWFRGSPALNATPMYRTHILELPQVGAAEEGVLTCRAQNSLGSQHFSLHLSVVCPPRLLGPSCSWEGEGLGCTCSARARPAPTLRWRLGEGLVEGNHSDASLTVTSSSEGSWANSSLSLRGPLGSDLRLGCEARNEHGAQSTAVLVLLPDKPEPRASGVLGAVGGAGIMTLLFSLCLCLIFRVKTLRKRAAQPVQIMDLNPAGDSGSGVSDRPRAPIQPMPFGSRPQRIVEHFPF
uniref:sialic acid-binding Ig-like lectin 5 n=1 Tax=Panthera onca TaxID=9690 RepID=UPI0029530B5A